MWTFNARRGGWELHRLPEVNPVNVAAGGLLTHLGGIALPTVSQYVLIALGVALSVVLRGRLGALLMAGGNVAVVPVIVRYLPHGGEHLERIDYANFGPVLTMVGCLAGLELLRVLYRRWSWNLCIPVPLVPKAAQPT
ncbi:hypothetical protein ACQ856_30115 (plasmid) [Mycolicibacterium psychrotolerans]|uniref:hypothetical protein n=1 Tax=Mycolicibacterium psychrotolerans TaxID=216929 RepID=UPI003D66A405